MLINLPEERLSFTKVTDDPYGRFVKSPVSDAEGRTPSSYLIPLRPTSARWNLS